MQVHLFPVPLLQQGCLKLSPMQYLFYPAGKDIILQGDPISYVMGRKPNLQRTLPQCPLGMVINLVCYCADSGHFLVQEGEGVGGEGVGVSEGSVGGVGQEVFESTDEDVMSGRGEFFGLIGLDLG